MADVFRQPDMLGPPVVFHYERAADGTRTPVAYSVDGAPWITDAELVSTATNALFARDAIYARAMQAISHILAPDGAAGDTLPTRRLDVGEKVVIGMAATGLTDDEVQARGAAVAEALTTSCADLLAAERLAALWAD